MACSPIKYYENESDGKAYRGTRSSKVDIVDIR